jgi:hypothetical protein
MGGRRFERNDNRKRKRKHRNYDGIDAPELVAAGFPERRDDGNQSNSYRSGINRDGGGYRRQRRDISHAEPMTKDPLRLKYY